MMTPAGLAEVARYADGIGVEATALIGADGKATSVIADAHAAGLQVHAWTLRRENRFLPAPLRIGTDPGAPGNFAAAWALLRAAGVDGVFTDNPGSVPGVRPGAVIHSH
jgi:glycerophosphoryl diester phosphodiesterase